MAQMAARQRTRRGKLSVPAAKSKITTEMLFATAEELHSGKIPLERMRYTDDLVVGLRMVVNATKTITFHIAYEVGDARQYMILGSLNKERPDYITLDEARELAKTVKALAAKGIDPQDGLHKRLIRELKRDGVAWKLPKN